MLSKHLFFNILCRVHPLIIIVPNYQSTHSDEYIRIQFVLWWLSCQLFPQHPLQLLCISNCSTSHQHALIFFFLKSNVNPLKQVNPDLPAKDESLLPKQSHKPTLHHRRPLLCPKEVLDFPENTHMLGLFSPWKGCNIDPSESLCGSAGKGCKEFVKERGGTEIRASLFPSEECISFRGEEMDGEDRVKQGYWTGLQTSLNFRISMLTWNRQIKFSAIESPFPLL